ncbi:MAG: hypothetical protein OXI71_11975 [Gemmatimonadota bacterium]|nr:hypothetical protein [Gemmatimonadota bacterium]MXX34303.1 hypothetical protein [Gemmatimonadota bacterium]MYD14130.1 hypothetical protein [Gemmatimonadota bacterium]
MARTASAGRLARGLLALGVVVALQGAGPAPQEPRLTMQVDTTLISVGDPVMVRLLVDHPADWTVQWPDSLDLSPFEVLHQETAEPGPAPSGEGMRSAAALVITSFGLGELEMPPIEVAVAAPDGTVRTLLTDPFRIGVESVGLDESGEIRDIKGPLSLARNWWTVVPWVLLVAALVAGAYYLHRRRRNRPSTAAPRPAPPPRPFHVVALEQLDELEASSLLERGQVKAYHIRISEIIRAYVEGQLEVPALEMTTREVVYGLRRASMSRAITGSFRSFLARCDLVKFAKWRPGADESGELMGVARSLVAMTSGVESGEAGAQ